MHSHVIAKRLLGVAIVWNASWNKSIFIFIWRIPVAIVMSFFTYLEARTQTQSSFVSIIAGAICKKSANMCIIYRLKLYSIENAL